jgi:hypothetical protein
VTTIRERGHSRRQQSTQFRGEQIGRWRFGGYRGFRSICLLEGNVLQTPHCQRRGRHNHTYSFESNTNFGGIVLY